MDPIFFITKYRPWIMLALVLFLLLVCACAVEGGADRNECYSC